MGEEGGGGVFVVEEPAFGGESAGEADESAVVSDDTVTGLEDGQGVAVVGEADGAAGAGLAELLGELGVGAGLAGGDLVEQRPDASLEVGAGGGGGQFEAEAVAGEVLVELSGGFVEQGVIGGGGGCGGLR